MDELPDDAFVASIGMEITRTFSAEPTESHAFMILPLVGRSDALAFLRTVPTGTPFEQLMPLEQTWRAAHPTSIGALYAWIPT